MQSEKTHFNNEERAILKALHGKSAQEVIRFLEGAAAREAEPSSRAVLSGLLVKLRGPERQKREKS